MGWFKCFGEAQVSEVLAASAANKTTAVPSISGINKEPDAPRVTAKKASILKRESIKKEDSLIVTEVQPFNVDEADVRNSDEEPNMQPQSSATSSGWAIVAHPKTPDAVLHPKATPIPEELFNGNRSGARVMFTQYDADKDGFLLKQDLIRVFRDLKLDLSQELFNQLLDCNFVYADRDHDNKLDFNEFLVLYKMLSDTTQKFLLHDEDADGMITKSQFEDIVRELDLQLDPFMLKHYVDLNFKFADRAMCGVISVGQFMACYANFLYSHAVTGGRRHSGHNGSSSSNIQSSNSHPVHHLHQASQEVVVQKVGDLELSEFT